MCHVPSVIARAPSQVPSLYCCTYVLMYSCTIARLNRVCMCRSTRIDTCAFAFLVLFLPPSLASVRVVGAGAVQGPLRVLGARRRRADAVRCAWEAGGHGSWGGV